MRRLKITGVPLLFNHYYKWINQSIKIMMINQLFELQSLSKNPNLDIHRLTEILYPVTNSKVKFRWSFVSTQSLLLGVRQHVPWSSCLKVCSHIFDSLSPAASVSLGHGFTFVVQHREQSVLQIVEAMPGCFVVLVMFWESREKL